MTQDPSTQPAGDGDPVAEKPLALFDPTSSMAGAAQCGVGQCDTNRLQASPAVNLHQEQ